MTDTTWKTYVGVLPVALALTGEAPLRYLGLALVSAQLWQIRRGRLSLLATLLCFLATILYAGGVVEGMDLS